MLWARAYLEVKKLLLVVVVINPTLTSKSNHGIAKDNAEELPLFPLHLPPLPSLPPSLPPLLLPLLCGERLHSGVK